MKPNKSILKRIKISKRGKVLKRKAGLNHFNAKSKRRYQLGKKVRVAFPRALEKQIKQLI